MKSIAVRISNMSLIVFYTMAYWAVGLTEEEYHIRKANYWSELGNYRRAIRNYQKSLKSSEDSRVRAAMAWCYSAIGLLETSREHYRTAFQRNKAFDIVLGLAYAELNIENVEECRSLLQLLRVRAQTPTEQQAAEISRLQAILDNPELSKKETHNQAL